MVKTLLILTALLGWVCASTIPPMPATDMADDCDDDPNEDCWSRPDEDCFGIFEPWSTVHCPLRCGFCPGKLPPCEDAIDYCSRYENSACSLESYRIWARTNCRKRCNLCAVPVRPAGSTVSMDGTTVSVPVPQGSTPTAIPSLPPVSTAASGTPTPPATPAMDSTTISFNGAAATGTQKTYIFQGAPAATPNMCEYKGVERSVQERWNEGCDYQCTCLDATFNRVICTQKCTSWDLSAGLTNCKMVQEDNECCPRLECM